MNIEYTAVMRRFSSHGWISMWDRSEPSVWLTAYCIRIFEQVAFQVRKPLNLTIKIISIFNTLNMFTYC